MEALFPVTGSHACYPTTHNFYGIATLKTQYCLVFQWKYPNIKAR